MNLVKKSFLYFITTLYFVGSNVIKNNDQNEIDDQLFGNDIEDEDSTMAERRVSRRMTRSAATNDPSKLWPKGIVPYVLDDKYKAKDKELIESAMKHIESVSCIRFKKWTNEKDYNSISPSEGDAKCSSKLGRKGGKQVFKLGKNCMKKGIVIHELMHAIGFNHEHQRSDRDKYLTIHMENVKPGAENNFELIAAKKEILLSKFDYDSIMIYKADSFSKSDKMTMEPKDKNVKLTHPRTKTEMTKSDALGINKLYKCPGH